MSLIDAARNTTGWTRDFDRDRRDVLALQRDVALAIAQAIQVPLTLQDQQRLAPARALNPEAFDLYLKGIHLGFAEAHHELGMLLQRVKRFGEALQASRQAAAHAPTSLRFINGIGEVLLSAGRDAEALAIADQILTTDSTFNYAYRIRGFAYEHLEQWDEARKAWVMCLRLSRRCGAAQVELGYIAGRTGEGFILYLAVNRAYAPLHDEPRFQALLKRVGLPTI